MKKSICIMAVLAILANLHAQTRRIAHRSHGGARNERYDGKDGNFGLPYDSPRLVKIHLESGKDTIVTENDSLFLRQYPSDSMRTLQVNPEPKKEIHRINQVGNVAVRMVSEG